MATFRLFLIRHGETEDSRVSRFAGARDVPLTPLGVRQAEAVAAALAGTLAVAVYTSPLERARATAEAIAKPHRLAVTVEPAFREMAFGAWEGLTRVELEERFPGAAGLWQSSPHLAAPPGGETLGQVAARTGAALAELRALHAGESVILVTHAVVARLIVLAALGLGPERLRAVESSPGGITEIEYEPATGESDAEWATVHRMNTLAHLEPVA